ncbi:MAG: DUF488 domain-containing protein [candidate division Zixibacteria bacterium]|nr:DUF488 domain-containing protein [candidate division Zixibacteria bacterium]
MSIKLFTIGYGKKPLDLFCTIIQGNGIRKIIDTRQNPNFIGSGEYRASKLRPIVEEKLGIEYQQIKEFAPTSKIRRNFRQTSDWTGYVQEYTLLLRSRPIPEIFDQITADCNRICLLCAEATPEECHRRLVAEYLKSVRPDLEIIHL